MEEPRRQRCAACNCASPAVNTNYTLIGGGHGWRSLIETDDEGRKKVKYFCKSCWAKRRDPTPRAT
ncbi:MAG TPA: hypothetical protein VM686_30000 [Polyangiaceae bacterium]|nr:hypothetical protein [Polyangiaceae bacterium]